MPNFKKIPARVLFEAVDGLEEITKSPNMEHLDPDFVKDQGLQTILEGINPDTILNIDQSKADELQELAEKDIVKNNMERSGGIMKLVNAIRDYKG